MFLYIVDNVSTCRIIYFRYVDTEKRIDNSPTQTIPKMLSPQEKSKVNPQMN